MKRIAAILISLVLVIACIPFTAGAVGAPTTHVAIADDATDVVIDGVTYTVVRTIADFVAINNGNYILANDIDFGGVTYTNYVVTSVANGTVIDGNGYRIWNYSAESTGKYAATFFFTKYATVRNLIIGKPNARVTFKAEASASAVGAIGGTMTAKYGTFENITVYADITATTGNAGGILGISNTKISVGVTNISNCVFYGTAIGKSAGGIVGASMGDTMFMQNCTNYGNIKSDVTSGGAAGGIIGKCVRINSTYSSANVDLIETSDTLGMKNYGKIESFNYAGGFTGWLNGSTKGFSLVGFLNTGDITATAAAGGVIGFGDNAATYIAVLDGCTNIGTISSPGTAGGLFGTYSKDVTLTIKNSRSYGIVTSDGAAGAILGTEGTASIQEAASTGNKWIAFEGSTTYGMTDGTAVTLEQALADLSENVTGDKFVRSFYYPVLATPRFRGIQKTETAEGKFDIRFVSVIDSLYYTTAGYEITVTITQDGGSPVVKTGTVNCNNVYGSINANGEISAYSAADLGGEYIMALTMTNIPADKQVEFEVTPFANDGTRYAGNTVTITYNNGVRVD